MSKYIKKDRSDETFQKWLRNKYGNYYDFSKSTYVDSKTPITVICPEHGEFQTNIYNVKCKECCKNNYKYCTENVKEKINSIYGDMFLLDKVEYHGDFERAKIILICSKCGNEIVRSLRTVFRGKCVCDECLKNEREINKKVKLFEKEKRYQDYLNKLEEYKKKKRRKRKNTIIRERSKNKRKRRVKKKGKRRNI